MKALVLSGGSGTRLRPFSYSMPKQLIPIANKPVLEHVLEGVRDLGVTDIGVIVGDGGQQIAEVIGDGSDTGVPITYIPQEEPLGLAHCVTLARSFLGDDDFVMYLGDNLLPEGVTTVAEDFAEHRPEAQIVVHKVTDPRAFGVAELDAEGRVERLVEKPREPRSDLALVGVYFFTPAIHEAVAAIEPSARGELEITDALQWLVANGHDVRASEYDGYWKDAGRVEDALACNRQLLETLKPSMAGEVDTNSRLDGTVVVEAGVRIVRSTVEGPAVIGAGSVIEDSHIGPGTSIGRDCVVHRTRLTDSIVLDGAEIRDVTPLRNSIIGRAAHVGAGEQETTHHRLIVGDDTRIEVAASC
ncbi:glucose-1-phosphate thymidylyltransferase [Streptomyces abyssalis]|uniref:Glucose-1-phosphate thymidylyltransferase n=1 Tax=Streptomyces abyssalis TaxID=933944 RepID=A0A1E7JGP1_9ACTN|nr:glucose-1-phosphate thymidylyltransferase [Streptomyces abyssalis]OEU85645.1 glucose-1-phosphate thymidylyltransferase [Streptomyces abyssalis]OEU92891.1 glucose-1-phosphate thymidylyltransferase [Streptomyces abyssalis]OEV30517.1 glucose-1-phosphate thymidylyltransferase [Streptomyces nanshensis]